VSLGNTQAQARCSSVGDVALQRGYSRNGQCVVSGRSAVVLDTGGGGGVGEARAVTD